MKKFLKTLALTLVFTVVLSTILVISPVASIDSEWKNYKSVTFTETAGIGRTNEPVDIAVTFDTPTPVNDIRVLDSLVTLNEVPSQVYNVVTDGSGKCVSANIAFLVNCPASSSVTYYIVYNKKTPAAPPVYDGLRFGAGTTVGSTYNITTLQTGVEKMYVYIGGLWGKQFVDLYIDGIKITGLHTDKFSHINLGSLYKDAWGGSWLGTGSALGNLTLGGPVFVDITYDEGWFTNFFVNDFNVTTTSTLRVWYQPDNHPLIQYRRAFNIKTNIANYTIVGPWYLSEAHGNSTGGGIYEHLTYKDNWIGWINKYLLDGTEDNFFGFGVLGNIYTESTPPLGWRSYNGTSTLPGQTDAPQASIGLIPTYCGGTIAGADYTVGFWHVTTDLTKGFEVIDNFAGTYNGVNGDKVETKGYIVTYGSNAEPYMSNKATKVRSPLDSTVGPEGPPGVGGHITPLDKLALLVPWISLAVAVAVAAVSVASYRKHRLTKTL